MPRPVGGFATGSKLLQKKWEERNYRAHQQKVNGMKTGVNNTSPKQYPHLVLRLKKIQKEEERQERIDHDNQMLLHKMTHIMKSKGRVDNWNSVEPKKTLHQGYRERELERIREENAGIARRLEKIRPSYDINDWESEFDRHEYYLDMWNQTTKDYQLSPRNGPARQNMADDEYESDFEDDNTSRKLPKIESRESSQSDRRSTAKRDTAVTKLPKIKTQKDSVTTQDAKLLFKATKQLTKADEAVIKALIKRTHSQRMATKDKFEESYDLDLAFELKSTLRAEHAPIIDALLAERESADADTIHTAIQGNDVRTLVEVLCSRNNMAINKINTTYSKQYGISMEEDIERSITDEECKALLLALFNTTRPKEANIDQYKAEDDARQIYESTGDRFDKEGQFLSVLRSSNMPHVKAVITSYSKVSGGTSLVTSMEEDNCSKAYIGAVQYMTECMSSSSSMYAKKIHDLLTAGDILGLASLLLERSELDLTDIRKSYKSLYHVMLVEDIQSMTNKEVGPLLAHIALKQGGRGGGGGGGGGTGGGGAGTTTASNKTKGGPTEGGSKASSRSKAAAPATAPPAPSEKKKSQGGSKPASTKTEDDVTKLYGAMKGFGTEEKVILDILTNRTNAQRQKIKSDFQDRYQKDLIDELKSELRGDFEEVIIGLLMAPTAYDAHCLHEAVSGLGTREAVLIGTLVTRSAKELEAVKSEYKKKYKHELEDDIHSDTSGEFQDLLMQLLRCERDQGQAVNEALAKADAEKLAKDSEGVIRDDDDFREILTKRNKSQLQLTFAEYKKITGQTVEEGIKKSMLGDAEDGFIALAQACSDPVDFYTRRLHDSMEGHGTNDVMLTRIIISRSEIDLDKIKVKYTELYGKSLEERIDEECSGDFRKALISLLRTKRKSKVSPKTPPLSSCLTGHALTMNTRHSARDDHPKTFRVERKIRTQTVRNKSVAHLPEVAPPAVLTRQQSYRMKRASSFINRQKSANGQDYPAQKIAVKSPRSNDSNPIQEKVAGSVVSQLSVSERIHAALYKPDEQAVCKILMRLSQEARHDLRSTYHKQYDKDMKTDIAEHLSRPCRHMAYTLLFCRAEYDAHCLYEALTCPEGDEDDEPDINTITEILITRNRKEKRDIKKFYRQGYGEELGRRLVARTTGEYQKFMLELLTRSRDISPTVNEKKAKQEAQRLRQGGMEGLSKALSRNNFLQIQLIEQQYLEIADVTMTENIRVLTDSQTADAYTGLLYYAEDKHCYYAERLHDALTNATPDGATVTRILAMQSKNDLAEITCAYNARYKPSLVHQVKRTCSGVHQKFLIALLREKKPTAVKNVLTPQPEGHATPGASTLAGSVSSTDDTTNSTVMNDVANSTVQDDVANSTVKDDVANITVTDDVAKNTVMANLVSSSVLDDVENSAVRADVVIRTVTDDASNSMVTEDVANSTVMDATPGRTQLDCCDSMANGHLDMDDSSSGYQESPPLLEEDDPMNEKQGDLLKTSIDVGDCDDSYITNEETADASETTVTGCTSVAADVIDIAETADTTDTLGTVDVGETPETDDVGETPETAHLGESPETADVGESSETADVGESSETVDIGETSETADVGDSSETADVGESSETADVGESSETVDIGETSETADVGDSSETVGIGETSETADVGDSSETAGVGETSETAGVGKSSETADVGETSETADVGESSETAYVADSSNTPPTADEGDTLETADVVDTPETADVVDTPETAEGGNIPVQVNEASNNSRPKDVSPSIFADNVFETHIDEITVAEESAVVADACGEAYADLISLHGLSDINHPAASLIEGEVADNADPEKQVEEELPAPPKSPLKGRSEGNRIRSLESIMIDERKATNTYTGLTRQANFLCDGDAKEAAGAGLLKGRDENSANDSWEEQRLFDGITTSSMEEVTITTYQGTIGDATDVDFNEDCQFIFVNHASPQALELLSRRSNAQRHEISRCFQEIYLKDLLTTLVETRSGLEEELVMLLIQYPEESAAHWLKAGMTSLDNDPTRVVEVLASHTEQEISDIADVYQGVFGTFLESDLTGVANPLRNLLARLAKRTCEDTQWADEKEITTIAEKLKQEELSINSETLVDLLVTKNQQAIRAVFDEYHKLYKTNLVESLDSADEVSQTALRILLEILDDSMLYFTTQLHLYLNGAAQLDRPLIYTLVARSELDLDKIKTVYEELYGLSLEHEVQRRFTNTAYAGALVEVVRGNIDFCGAT